MNIGDRILNILSSAKKTVRITAPFIKAQTLEQVLGVIPESIHVTCITRWRPEDIALGVCDLEIFDQLKERDQSDLMIHPNLHAKLFAADEVCLVGSANLTATALGWRSPQNLELMITLKTSDHRLNDWWDELLEDSIEATEEMRDALRSEVEILKASFKPIQLPKSDQNNEEVHKIWVPECPRLSGLWEAYSGDKEKLAKSAFDSAMADLAVLNLPPGMHHVSFQKSVKTAVRNTQLFQEVNKLTQKGLSDSVAHKFLIEQCDIAPNDVDRRWNVIKSWISKLFPDEFRIEPSEEVLIQGRNI